MKKLILVYVVLIIAVILLAVFRAGGKLPSFNLFAPKSTATVNGKQIGLLLAKSSKDRQVGLSGRKNLPADQGMLFVFAKKDKYAFWMKNTQFPLDIIWLDDNTVVYIVQNAPSSLQAPNLTIYTPNAAANYVLEVNAGQANKLGIKKGTKITFKGI